MNKLYNKITFENDNVPALNESNLNSISKAIDDIDDRLIDVAGLIEGSISMSYTDLTDKPSINGVTLEGNKTSANLSVTSTTVADKDHLNVGQGNTINTQGASYYPVGVVGQYNQLSQNAKNSFVSGMSNNVTGDTSIVAGNGNKSSGSYSAVLGLSNEATGSNSVVLGKSNKTTSNCANAIGYGLKNSNMNSIVVGNYNTDKTGVIFAVGNGSSDSSRHNALEVTTANKIILGLPAESEYPIKASSVEDTQGNKLSKVASDVAQLNSDIVDLNDMLIDGEDVSFAGDCFTISDAISDISFESTEVSETYCVGKNYWVDMSKLGTNAIDGITNLELGNGTVKGTCNGQYKFLRTNFIYLPKGTYVIHAEYDILSGQASGNIGFTYIQKKSKSGTYVGNIDSIPLNATTKKANTRVTLTDDAYLRFEMYANFNGTVSLPLTIQWKNLSITQELTFSGYELYKGKVIKGTSGIFEYFNDMCIYSNNEITINYLAETSESYTNIKKRLNALDGLTNNIICWGDSLTEGSGSNISKPSTETATDCSYPSVLGRLLSDDFNVLNGGVGGEPSWMIASRQGGDAIMVEPTTIPATKTAIEVTLKGQEQNYFYNSGWTYLENNLPYAINVGNNSMVNPCYIDGVKGVLTKNDNKYYFTRDSIGEELTFVTPKQLITNGYKVLKDYIPIIWVGQNDAPSHSGQYITQGNSADRVEEMLSIIPHKKYIVMDCTNGGSGTNENMASQNQTYTHRFGSHYINIREYICKYGIAYANSRGASITPSEADTEQINNGTIPNCLRSDGVHGNYWLYQIVAKAVYDKGISLGYWN